MAIEFACGRLALCTEEHPVWRFLIEVMPSYLPGVIPFDAWAPALSCSPAAILVIHMRKLTGHA